MGPLDVDEFKKSFPEDWSDYRGMFNRKLAGEEVFVKPAG
jgi:hypothetical protein